MRAPRRLRLAAGLCLAALAAAPACSTEIRLTESRLPGSVRLEFADAAGGCVRGVEMEFRFPDGNVQRTTNPFSCEQEILGPAGEWRILLTPPPGFRLGPEQPNPLVVQVRREQTTRVRVALVAGP